MYGIVNKVVPLGIFSPSAALAAVPYTSMISSGDFDGPRADLLTTVTGVVSLLFIVLAVAYLARVLR